MRAPANKYAGTEEEWQGIKEKTCYCRVGTYKVPLQLLGTLKLSFVFRVPKAMGTYGHYSNRNGQ